MVWWRVRVSSISVEPCNRPSPLCPQSFALLHDAPVTILFQRVEYEVLVHIVPGNGDSGAFEAGHDFRRNCTDEKQTSSLSLEMRVVKELLILDARHEYNENELSAKVR